MIKVNCQVNFEFLLEHHQNTRALLLEGGSRSGKTTDTCQFLVWYCLNNTGKVITVGRDTLTTLRATLLIDFKQVLRWWGRSEQLVGVNPQITINDNLIRFIGTNDDLMKTHGLTQDVFWLNEAMNISKDTIDQLEQRTSEFFILDYNPSALEHHIYEMELRDDVKLLKTTVLDNAFAPLEAKKKILSYEPTPKNIALGTADQYKWEVYGLGKRAVQDGLVFPNWETYSIEPDGYDLKIYGLDFGYTNDPTACVEVLVNGNNIFVKELIYETGLGNADIADRLKDLDKNCYIVADSAEPKSIDELRMLGLSVTGSIKGADSIRNGIAKIKSKKIHLHVNSDNLIKEFKSYQYKKDRQSNKILNIPIEGKDHLIDALRYSLTLFNI
jgi:phage terminase large subunit